MLLDKERADNLAVLALSSVEFVYSMCGFPDHTSVLIIIRRLPLMKPPIIGE